MSRRDKFRKHKRVQSGVCVELGLAGPDEDSDSDSECSRQQATGLPMKVLSAPELIDRHANIGSYNTHRQRHSFNETLYLHNLAIPLDVVNQNRRKSSPGMMVYCGVVQPEVRVVITPATPKKFRIPAYWELFPPLPDVVGGLAVPDNRNVVDTGVNHLSSCDFVYTPRKCTDTEESFSETNPLNTNYDLAAALETKPSSYMWLAILTLFFNVVVGIIALVIAMQSDNEYWKDNFESARKLGRIVKYICITAIIITATVVSILSTVFTSASS